MPMKRFGIAVAIMCMCLLVAGVIAQNKDRPKLEPGVKTIAVLNIQCGIGVDPRLGASFAEIVIGEFTKVKKYYVAASVDRQEIFSKAGIDFETCVDEKCALDAGRKLSVDQIISGSISLINETYIINLKLIDVATSKLDKSVNEECKCDFNSLVIKLRSAAHKLMASEYIETFTIGSPAPDGMKFVAATADENKLCPPGMVYIPAGWFMMGCNFAIDTACESDEQPYHPVFLDPYCIDKYEYPNKAGEKPRNRVPYFVAEEICFAQKKRLLSEAEWEKASRGTDGRIFPWGNEMTEEKEDALKKSYLSGEHSWNVSPYGIYDMAGSLKEWTSDFYEKDYYKKGPTMNPPGPNEGKDRSLRGGSWIDGPPFLRTSNRWFGSATKFEQYGLRCAVNP